MEYQLNFSFVICSYSPHNPPFFLFTLLKMYHFMFYVCVYICKYSEYVFNNAFHRVFVDHVQV